MPKRARARSAAPTILAPERQHRTYTEADKLRAVAAMLTFERPLSLEAQNAARTLLDAHIGTGTLGKWLETYRETVRQASALTKPEQPLDVRAIVAEAEDATVKLLGEVRDTSLTLAHEIAQEFDKSKATSGDYRNFMVGTGIAQDHLRAMSGYSPDEVARLRLIRDRARRLGEDHLAILDDLIAAMDDKLHELQSLKTITTKAEQTVDDT